MFLLSIILMVSCVAAAGVGFGLSLLSRYSQGLPDVERLRSYQPSETTRIYAANGELIGTLFKENRTWVPFDKVPTNFRHAILAVEDARFYQHQGVDFVGIMRAAVADYRTGGTAQGASTITMQLARNIFLHPRATIQRKIQEMLISMQLEKKFTKDEILELYLNQIYFGSGAYGVEAAAEVYFNKKVAELTLAESAVIAGLPAAPSRYSPQLNLGLAKQRQILVLKRMVDVGYITQRQALDAIQQRLNIAEPRQTFNVLKLPYFTTYVMHELFQKYDEDLLYRGGLRIYTTVEPKLQEWAEEAVRWGVAQGRWENIHQSALVSIEPKTGYIRALVGGLGWTDRNQFNRAWQALRQPGSSFKLFVYTTAIDNGYSPDMVVPDSPVTFRVSDTESWSPVNSGGSYMGAIPLRTALQMSRNVVAAKLCAALGPDRVIDYAYKMGIRGHIDPNLSIALGAIGASPLEMCSAFAVIANNGIKIEPSAIRLIKDPEGNVLEDNTFPYQQEVITQQTALTMCEMLQAVVDGGTGTAAQLPGRPVGGKTGTTDSHRDVWFCGFTPQLVTAVWAGNDDNTPMFGSFGGTICAPIWQRFMAKALKGKPVMHWGADAKGKVEVAMCETTKKRANANCPSVTRKTFPWKELPHQYCSIHLFEPGRWASRDAKATTARPDTSTHRETRESPATRPQPQATPVEGPVGTPADVPEAVPTPPEVPPDQPVPIDVTTPQDTAPAPPAHTEPAPAPVPVAPAPAPTKAAPAPERPAPAPAPTTETEGL